MIHRRCFAGALFVALATAQACFAGGVIRDSIGARASGRGGANLAFNDTGAMLLDNPAAMARMDRDQLLELGCDVLITDLQYADADNASVGASDNPFPAGQFSFIRRDPDGIWAYGLGVYSVAGFCATYDMVAPNSFNNDTHRYKSLGMLVKVLPGLSCRLTDRWTIGGTLGVAASHMEMEGPYFLQGPNQLQSLPVMLDLQATGAAPTWSLGMQFELSEKTTLGIAYQSETKLHLAGHSVIDAGALGSTRYKTKLDVVWPQSLGVGLKHSFCRHHTVAADLLWYQWSRAFDKFRLQFEDSEVGGFPDLYEEFPLDWSDTVALRFGHEYRPVAGRVFRWGYIHSPNPIPNGTLTPYMQATLEHAFSLGYGWTTATDLEIDLAYQFAFSSDRQVQQSDLLGGDFSNSRHRSQAHWTFLSVMKRY